MKIRLKFSKAGSMKFIGHLDIMRFFQKVFRRSELDMVYSQGFNPHPVMSFAAPLGVGLTSDGEYLDMELHSADQGTIMLQKINASMNEEIRALSYRLLPENTKNAMSAVAAADYLVSLKDGYKENAAFQKELEAFLNQDEILVMKKTKKSQQLVDIKSMIFLYAFKEAAFKEKGGCIPQQSTAEEYENDNRVFLRLETGSVRNLKPSLVMDAFCEASSKGYQIHRLELLENRDGLLVPLGEE